MKIEAIRNATENFDGKRHVDIFVNGRADPIGLGRIKLCNVTYEMDADGVEDTVIVTSEHGDCTLYLDPCAILGFGLIALEGDE